MKVLVIIPARMASTRFPGKALAKLSSGGGTQRPLIEWCWRAAQAAVGAEAVVVATDDDAIASCVRDFGGKSVMTDASLRNGTERVAAALAQMDAAPDVVINLQGDSPLVPSGMIDGLVSRFEDAQVQVATPYIKADRTMQERILGEFRDGKIGGTCVVSDTQKRALYFSKYPIPHGADAQTPLALHIGLYGYRPSALAAYCDHAPSALELAEGLEQLRFLDMGMPVHMVETALPEGGLWEVNNPTDVAIVEALLPRS